MNQQFLNEISNHYGTSGLGLRAWSNKSTVANFKSLSKSFYTIGQFWHDMNDLKFAPEYIRIFGKKIDEDIEEVDFAKLLQNEKSWGHTNLRAVQEYILKKRYSIIINYVHLSHPEFFDICKAFEFALKGTARANLFYTHAGVAALPIHQDPEETFAIQMQGSKTWRIYTNDIEWPLENHQIRYFSSHKRQLFFSKTSSITITTYPGDVIHIPRGVPHEAVADGADSLHLSIGFLRDTAHDVIKQAAIDALGELELTLKAREYLLLNDNTLPEVKNISDEFLRLYDSKLKSTVRFKDLVTECIPAPKQFKYVPAEVLDYSITPTSLLRIRDPYFKMVKNHITNKITIMYNNTRVFDSDITIESFFNLDTALTEILKNKIIHFKDFHSSMGLECDALEALKTAKELWRAGIIDIQNGTVS